jgi:hypothetical protein
VTHVDPEVALPLQPLGDRQHDRRIDFLDSATIAAHQVDVLILTRGMVGRRAVRQVRVADQAQLLEQLEGATVVMFTPAARSRTV